MSQVYEDYRVLEALIGSTTSKPSISVRSWRSTISALQMPTSTASFRLLNVTSECTGETTSLVRGSDASLHTVRRCVSARL